MLLNNVLDNGTLVAPRIPMTVAELLAEGQRVIAEREAEEARLKQLEQEKHNKECNELAAWLAKTFGNDLAETAVGHDGERPHVAYGFNQMIGLRPFGHARINVNIGRNSDGFKLTQYTQQSRMFMVERDWSVNDNSDGELFANMYHATDSLAEAVALCASEEEEYKAALAKLEAEKKQQPAKAKLNPAALSPLFLATIALHSYVKDEVAFEGDEEVLGYLRDAEAAIKLAETV